MIQTVAAVGTVHTWERSVGYAGDMWDLFKYTATNPDTARGWMIRLVSTDEVSPDLGQYAVTHRWELAAIWQVVDADGSEVTFDDTIDAVRTAFRSDDTLGGVVATCVVDGEAGAQMPEHDIVEFAGVLCHAAILTLLTRHYLP